MKQQPTIEQMEALKEFARLHGRNWKAPLRQAWYDGNYHGFAGSNFLQQIRNTFGPTWLVNFRLSKEAQ